MNPALQEYMQNIAVVDAVVRDAEKLVSDFYGDAETSYIFTADHGMSRIGNHGDGGMTESTLHLLKLIRLHRS